MGAMSSTRYPGPRGVLRPTAGLRGTGQRPPGREGVGPQDEFPVRDLGALLLPPQPLRAKVAGRGQERTLDRLLLGGAFQKSMTPLSLRLSPGELRVP